MLQKGNFRYVVNHARVHEISRDLPHADFKGIAGQNVRARGKNMIEGAIQIIGRDRIPVCGGDKLGHGSAG